MFLLRLTSLSPLDKEVIDLEKARSCAYQANYHLIWATKYRRKVLLGSVEVRLEEVLKTIANQSGFQLLTAKFMVAILYTCLFLLRQVFAFLKWFVF
jgi:hypothetical protein